MTNLILDIAFYTKKIIKKILKYFIFRIISFVSLVSGFEILIKKQILLSKQHLPECHPYFGWQTPTVDLSQYAIPDYFNEFLVRINTVYSIEEFPCPLTNQFTYTKVASSEYGFEWALSSSGLLQMNKRFTESSLNLFYKSGDYRKITMGGATDAHLFNLEYKIMSKYFLEIFNSQKINIRGKKIFELGCGSGGILLALKEQGAFVTGVDLDEGAINYGKQYLDELYCDDAKNYLKNVNFDFVILSNVLEHLHNPLVFLRELSIKQSARLIIDVPNLLGAHSYSDSFNKFLHIAHIWYFTPATLCQLLKLAGFSIDFISDRGSAMTIICSKTNNNYLNFEGGFSFITSASAINHANYLSHSEARIEIKKILEHLPGH